MKAILAILFVFMFASCDKKEKKQINAEELKAKYGIVLPELEYEGDEIATSNKGGAKKKANAVLVVVWFTDLSLTNSGGILTSTLSENAQWAGVQKFLDTTSTVGASSVCNWYYIDAPEISEPCQSTGSGNYRSWTSDFDYNIHISNWVTL